MIWYVCVLLWGAYWIWGSGSGVLGVGFLVLGIGIYFGYRVLGIKGYLSIGYLLLGIRKLVFCIRYLFGGMGFGVCGMNCFVSCVG